MKNFFLLNPANAPKLKKARMAAFVRGGVPVILCFIAFTIFAARYFHLKVEAWRPKARLVAHGKSIIAETGGYSEYTYIPSKRGPDMKHYSLHYSFFVPDDPRKMTYQGKIDYATPPYNVTQVPVRYDPTNIALFMPESELRGVSADLIENFTPLIALLVLAVLGGTLFCYVIFVKAVSRQHRGPLTYAEITRAGIDPNQPGQVVRVECTFTDLDGRRVEWMARCDRPDLPGGGLPQPGMKVAVLIAGPGSYQIL